VVAEWNLVGGGGGVKVDVLPQLHLVALFWWYGVVDWKDGASHGVDYTGFCWSYGIAHSGSVHRLPNRNRKCHNEATHTRNGYGWWKKRKEDE
jgi:hypothetical protein